MKKTSEVTWDRRGRGRGGAEDGGRMSRSGRRGGTEGRGQGWGVAEVWVLISAGVRGLVGVHGNGSISRPFAVGLVAGFNLEG